MTNTIQEGDKVLCKRGNIEKDAGAGMIGTVKGFARFSQYHGREVAVYFGDSYLDFHPADGWFWLSDVEPASSATQTRP